MHFSLLSIMVLLVYILIGSFFHVWLIFNHTYYNESPYGRKVWITFCNIVLWWLFMVIMFCWLVITWAKDPEAPTIKELLGIIMPYEKWVSLLRWLAVLGFLFILGTYGPRYRNWPAPPDEQLTTPEHVRDSLNALPFPSYGNQKNA